MVHDVVKLALAAAVIIVVIALIALLVTGYISAFKPGGTVDKSKNATSSSYKSTGGAVSKNIPKSTVSPKPTPAGGYYGGPGYAQPEPVQPMYSQPAYTQPAYSQPQQSGYYSPPTSARPEAGYQQQPAGPENATAREGVQEADRGVTPELARPQYAWPGGITQPGMPDMSIYFIGWRTIIEQLFQMWPFIFSKQFGGMPVWPVWPC